MSPPPAPKKIDIYQAIRKSLYVEIGEFIERHGLYLPTGEPLVNVALRYGNLEVAKELISYDYEHINYVSRTCDLPIVIAAKEGLLEMVVFMVNESAQVGIILDNISIPHAIISEADMPEILHYLFMRGAPLRHGDSILHIGGLLENALYHGRLETVKYLMHVQKMRFYEEDLPRYCPISTVMQSAPKNALDLISFCLGEGAFVNGYPGYSPLHIAVISGDCECVKLLLSHGADVNDPDENGKTPIQTAREMRDVEMIKILSA
jgi:ankyrin repeat protein